MYFMLSTDLGNSPVILCEASTWEELVARFEEHWDTRLSVPEHNALCAACEDDGSNLMLDMDFPGLPMFRWRDMTFYIQCIDGLFPGR